MAGVKNHLLGASESSSRTFSVMLLEADISYRNVLVVLIPTICVLALGSTWYHKSANSKQGKSRPLPPGSLGLPFLGDTLKYVNAYYNMAIKSYVDEKTRKYGAVFKVSLMGQKVVFLDAPAGTKLVLRHDDVKLIKGYWPNQIVQLLGKNGFTGQYGDEYFVLRNHVMRNFLDVDVVQQYIQTMEKKVVDQIRKYWLTLEDGAVVKSLELMSVITFSLITQLCMGISDEEEIIEFRPVFHEMAAGLVTLPINLPGFQLYRSLKAKKLLNEMTKVRIQRRREDLTEGRATPTQDLLSVFLTKPNEQGRFFGDDEICDIMLQLVFGGHDTSASVLTIALRFMHQNPAVYRELKQEHERIAANKKEGEFLTREDVWSMKVTWRVLQEIMRLYPANQVTFREARETFEHNGYTIPKGWKLCFSPANSSWNPNLCKDPEKFNPSRFEQESMGPYVYFPFSGGHRSCPGKDFARFQLPIVLHHFLRNIEWTVVNPQEKVVYDFLPRPVDGSLIKVTKIKR